MSRIPRTTPYSSSMWMRSEDVRSGPNSHLPPRCRHQAGGTVPSLAVRPTFPRLLFVPRRRQPLPGAGGCGTRRLRVRSRA